MTYPELVDSVKNGVNFSWSRFGDGELNCMYGKSGANCDGHEYYPDLSKQLIKAFVNPKGIVGMQRYGYEMYKSELGPNVWADADILHKASINGELNLFMDALKHKQVILVGPERLGALPFLSQIIPVPLKNAWNDYKRVSSLLKEFMCSDAIVLLCCGMMAEVLIWDLCREDVTMIDAGSVFDPYCGYNTRNYHKKLAI